MFSAKTSCYSLKFEFLKACKLFLHTSKHICNNFSHSHDVNRGQQTFGKHQKQQNLLVYKENKGNCSMDGSTRSHTSVQNCANSLHTHYICGHKHYFSYKASQTRPVTSQNLDVSQTLRNTRKMAITTGQQRKSGPKETPSHFQK